MNQSSRSPRLKPHWSIWPALWSSPLSSSPQLIVAIRNLWERDGFHGDKLMRSAVSSLKMSRSFHAICFPALYISRWINRTYACRHIAESLADLMGWCASTKCGWRCLRKGRTDWRTGPPRASHRLNIQSSHTTVRSVNSSGCSKRTACGHLARNRLSKESSLVAIWWVRWDGEASGAKWSLALSRT